MIYSEANPEIYKSYKQREKERISVNSSQTYQKLENKKY